MGTSSSSKGPKGGVSFDPPWLDISVSAIDGSSVPIPDSDAEMPLVAPANRFTSARRSFSSYMRSGRPASFRKAMGSYVRHGLGGVSRAARRMRFVTAVGARTFSLFTESQNVGQLNTQIRALLASPHTTRDVISAIVNCVVPTSGSVDEETCRNAMAEALSDLLLENSTIDLLNLSEEDVWYLLELFTGKAIVRQVRLDIGQTLESDALSIEERIRREEEIERFTQAVVSASFHKVRQQTSNISQHDITNIIHEAIKTTFAVFGKYR